MVVKLENVVPLGRSFDEYRLMFELDHSDLEKKIVGVSDGVSSFNTEMNAMGHWVTSIDPLYELPGEEIEKLFYASIDNVVEQLRDTSEDYNWQYFQSPEDYRQARVNVINRFLADYERGKSEGRYVTGELPVLEYRELSFDLALSAHLLFFYSELFDYDTHLASVRELARIAREVRIFPLMDISVVRSPHVEPLVEELENEGYSVELQTVDYDLMRGANQMMRVRKKD